MQTLEEKEVISTKESKSSFIIVKFKTIAIIYTESTTNLLYISYNLDFVVMQCLSVPPFLHFKRYRCEIS